jgi:hypothetical protein
MGSPACPRRCAPPAAKIPLPSRLPSSRGRCCRGEVDIAGGGVWSSPVRRPAGVGVLPVWRGRYGRLAGVGASLVWASRSCGRAPNLAGSDTRSCRSRCAAAPGGCAVACAHRGTRVQLRDRCMGTRLREERPTRRLVERKCAGRVRATAPRRPHPGPWRRAPVPRVARIGAPRSPSPSSPAAHQPSQSPSARAPHGCPWTLSRQLWIACTTRGDSRDPLRGSRRAPRAASAIRVA